MNLRQRLISAIAQTGAPSSDYDLNKDHTRPKQQLREAAVLVAIVEGPRPSVILTKRSSALKHHPGQIAFPGGKVEDTDSDVAAAAVREAEEEIALKDVEVLGPLTPHETVTGFNVTPVVGIVPPDYKAAPDFQEVAEIFEVPLEHVVNHKAYMVESRIWRGTRRHFFVVPWGPYYIWGATARMLRVLADRISDAH